MTNLQLMITLIEGHYKRTDRNTVPKMIKLIKKEFKVNVFESEVLHAYGLDEDYEMESYKIENGYN